jgi:hypothetical protein
MDPFDSTILRAVCVEAGLRGRARFGSYRAGRRKERANEAGVG